MHVHLSSIIGAAIVGKLGLWLFCKTMQNQSPAMLALAQVRVTHPAPLQKCTHAQSCLNSS
jgi:hypothetical protein